MLKKIQFPNECYLVAPLCDNLVTKNSWMLFHLADCTVRGEKQGEERKEKETLF